MMMNNRTGVKAVIFDWAGTTVDYGCMAPAKVFVDVFSSRNIYISIAEARGPMGLSKRDHVKELLKLSSVREQWLKHYGKDPSPEDEENIYRDIEPSMAAIAGEYAKPIDGAVDTLKELQKSGIRVGTTTGYVEPIMKHVTQAAASYGFMPDAVVTSSDVKTGRPAPYMCYLNALILDVFPLSQMIKVGDTVADILEGINAGMWTIGLTLSGNEIGLTEEETESLGISDLKSRLSAAEKRFKDAGAHYVAEGIWDCLPIIDQIHGRIMNGEHPAESY